MTKEERVNPVGLSKVVSSFNFINLKWWEVTGETVEPLPTDLPPNMPLHGRKSLTTS